jgi:hypothetical protein
MYPALSTTMVCPSWQITEENVSAMTAFESTAAMSSKY